MKKLHFVIILLTLILTAVLCYYRFAFLNIIVKFDELEPFEKQIPVYYKGFKIGDTTKIYPDKDYIYSYVNIRLSPRDAIFPSNIEAKLETGGSGNYINLLAPKTGTVRRLQDGDIINGKASPDFKRLITETLGSSNIGTIVDGASNLMVSADNTMNELTELFSRINSIVEDMRNDLKRTSSNLADITENISELSSNINGALDKDTVGSSVKNIKETSDNIKKVTKQINDITIPELNNVLCETERTMNNTAELSEDIKTSVKERKGITRIFFGSKNN